MGYIKPLKGILASLVLSLICINGFSQNKGEGLQYSLIVLAGQSNMQGIAARSELAAGFRLPTNIIYINYGQTPTLEIDSIHFGPEVGLARALAYKFPHRKFVLFKYAVGGASLLDFAPNYDREKAKITQTPSFEYLYLTFIQKLDSVMNRCHCKLSAVYWMQGEGDARFKEAAVHYYSNLSNLIGHIRSQVDFPRMPFIFRRVNPPAAIYEGVKDVRAAQEKAARSISECFMVDTDGLSKLPDHLYYNVKGQLKSGELMAEKLIPIIENEN